MANRFPYSRETAFPSLTAAPNVPEEAAPLSQERTTLFERVLLSITFIIFPLENQLPTVGGLSIAYLLFFVTALYLVLARPWAIRRVWQHPVYLASYVFLLLAFLNEPMHPDVDYETWSRIALMFLGAVSISALCRDKAALRAGLYSCLFTGVWLAVMMYLTGYGILKGETATNFAEASRLRTEISHSQSITINLNTMSLFIAQGAIIALSFALLSARRAHRFLYMGLCAFCLVAAFLPVSRSGIVSVVLSLVVVLVNSRARGGSGYKLLIALALGGVLVALVPNSVYARLAYSTAAQDQYVEARARLNRTVYENAPEFMLAGVGAGNFEDSWGKSHGFATKTGVSGAHNSFFQVTINWGIVGLLALLLVLRQVYRSLRALPVGDRYALCLRGLAFALFLSLFATHDLYAKEYSLGLGLFVAAQRWIWPGKSEA